METEKKLKFKRAKSSKQFSEHNQRNFMKFIQLLSQNGTLPITKEGAKFGKVNGYAVFTKYQESEPHIKTASIFFVGKKGKAMVTLYNGPVRRFTGDNANIIRNTYNVVNAPGSIVTQIKTTIENWLN